jgi:hypothetical protein
MRLKNAHPETTGGEHGLRGLFISFAKHTVVTAGFLILLMGVAAAQPEGCTVPSELQPIFDMLNAIADMAVVFAVSLVGIAIAGAGAMYAWPGEDMNRRAKSTITAGIIGAVIAMSASAIVAWVTTQMGSGVCG